MTLSLVQSDWLETRSFDAKKDHERLVAWGGLQEPAFLQASCLNNAPAASKAVLAFMGAAAQHYVAVCARSAFTRESGIAVSGPIACIDTRDGAVFIDSDFASHDRLQHDVRAIATGFVPQRLSA